MAATLQARSDRSICWPRPLTARPARRRSDIDRNRLLVTVDAEIEPGDRGAVGKSKIGRPIFAAEIAFARSLDLDHLGAELGEQLRGEWGGDDAPEVQNSHTGQW